MCGIQKGNRNFMNKNDALDAFLEWARPLWDGLHRRSQNRAVVTARLEAEYPFGYRDPLDRWLIVIRQISMTLSHHRPFEVLLIRLAREAILEHRGNCNMVQEWDKIGVLPHRLQAAWPEASQLATFPRLRDADEDTTPIIWGMVALGEVHY